jgi:homopolymeric O-antigen transport system ATP-binding protein
MNGPAISVEGLSKEYRLGVINHGTLFRDLQSFWARKLGRPDPNAVIGARQGQPGERFQALDKISFTVQPGETLGIIGRNGAGKSTLLKVLSRVTAPTSGRVLIRGRLSSLLEVGTGFHPELTGRENIFLNGAILGMSKTEIRGRLDEIIAFSEVEQFIDTPVKRYSSGMYVRLAFAVAAHLEPEILVVDEVLAVGDYEFQKKCLGKMKHVSTEGRTILFVSHNMTAINSLCGRSIWLDSGRIQSDGPSPEITRVYLSTAAGSSLPRKRYPHDLADDRVARITELSVINEAGELTHGYELTKPFKIRIQYHLKAEVAGATVGLQILSDDSGETIISLSDTELEPSRLQTRKSGTHMVEVQIPDRLLNTGTYSVRVGISRSRHEILDVAEGLSFRIVDSIGIVQYLGFERKSSLLALQLPWNDIQ